MLQCPVLYAKEVNAMPNIKSAIKRVKITRKRTLRNASAKSALRTAIKKFENALSRHDTENLEPLLRHATRMIDKAVTKGILHRNAAARKKSRLTKKFNKFQQSAS
jgi:small subunit ribosomal protein S20